MSYVEAREILGKYWTIHTKLPAAPVDGDPECIPHGFSVKGKQFLEMIDELDYDLGRDSLAHTVNTQVALLIDQSMVHSLCVQIAGTREDLTVEVQGIIGIHLTPKSVNLSIIPRDGQEGFRAKLNEYIGRMDQEEHLCLAMGYTHVIETSIRNSGVELPFD